MKRRILITAVLLIALLLPMAVKSAYYIHILILAMMYIMMTEGLNLLTGYVGLLSVGHIAFLGIGAYASALISLNFGVTPLLCMLIAGIVSALFSFFVGTITLRVRGSYFVILTSALSEITKLVVNNSEAVTNGPMGLRNVPSPVLFGFEISSKVSYYYFGLVLVVITTYVCYRIVNSKYGRAFKALREQEELARTVGIGFKRYAMVTVVVSGFFAGVAGSYYVHYTNFISPDIFAWSYTTTMLLMLVIGGKGTIAGPIIGSLLFSFIPELLRAYDDFRLPIYGLILMVSILLMPDGIIAPISHLASGIQKRIGAPRLKS